MGRRNRELLTEDHNSTSIGGSLSEALLFTTFRLIDLRVDVHVKDGSIYSGIFHTASVDADYGAFPFSLFFISSIIFALLE